MKRKVFNLTNSTMSFHGKNLAPRGGMCEVEFKFLPQRDLDLVSKGKISLDTLPTDWKPKVEKTQTKAVKVISLEVKDTAEVLEEPKASFEYNSKKKQKWNKSE